jgi:hypothetical protein
MSGLSYSANSYSYSYSYSYAGANSYSYGAANDATGIGGFAGDPMLSAAIGATRDALLSEVTISQLGKGGDRRAGKEFSGELAEDKLPTLAWAPDIGTYATQVRASLALFELSSSVSFRVKDNKQAILEGSWLDSGDVERSAQLLTMERPSRAYFDGQLQLVDAWSSRRDVRAAEIVTQVVPPVPYFASLLNMQAGTHRRTLELINAALQFTYAVCMQFKHALACPRPSEYSVGVQAMIEVPMHPTLPAGHAAEAHVTAAILAKLAGVTPDSTTSQMLRRLAFRIAENRVIAGVHFPVDMTAGRLLGDALAEYLLARCGAEPKWSGGQFRPDGSDEGHGRAGTFDATNDRFGGLGCSKLNEAGYAGVCSPLLRQMWRAAADEWQRRS